MLEYASSRVPMQALSTADGVLAVIVATAGASYRTVGTMMAFCADGRRIGSLSSGCIEDDIADHAAKARHSGQARTLQYGIGSPFFDLKLPCGGGLTVLLIPNPDKPTLAQTLTLLAARTTAHLSVGLTSGALTLVDADHAKTDHLIIKLEPELRFWVYGHGVEALSFAAMTHAAGYDVTLFGQENLQLGKSQIGSLPVQPVTSFRSYVCPTADARTAVTLFFHDHENEAQLLAQFLPGPAFYIGAQGSLRARTRLIDDLKKRDVTPDDLQRLRPDFGLIPSCRDPRTLAVSVMAHVLAVANLPEAASPSNGQGR